MKTFLLLLITFPVFSLDIEFKPIESQIGSLCSLELDILGLSYHTNRNYNFNEVNPGIGLNFGVKGDSGDALEIVLSGVRYEDSYGDLATFVGIGPRCTVGGRKSLHASVCVLVGHLRAYKRQTLALPVLSVGYGVFDVCVTGDPTGTGGNYPDSSAMVAVFVKFRLWEF